MHVVIHTDGGSRGNPGAAASAFTVQNSQNELVHSDSKYLGVTTNNVAEYSALRMAVTWLSEVYSKFEVESCDLLMDSELIVKQMKGEYKVRDLRLKLIFEEINRIKNMLPFSITFVHVPRAENSLADELVNITLDAQK